MVPIDLVEFNYGNFEPPICKLSLDLSFVMRINMSYVWPIERLCVINCPSSGLRVLKVLRDEMFIP